MSTSITDHGVVGSNSASSNSVAVTLTNDIPHGTPDDPNCLVAVIAYQGDIGPLDGSNGFYDSNYAVGITDNGTRNRNPYYGFPNQYQVNPQRISLRSPAGNLGLTTPAFYAITQDLDAGDIVTVTLNRYYGAPQPTWIGVKLHYFTGVEQLADPAGYFTYHVGASTLSNWALLTFPTTTSPATMAGITSDANVFKYRWSIHEPDEAVTWTQPHPTNTEQFHWSRGTYRASYRFDPEEASTTTAELISFPSGGSHLIYFGQMGLAFGSGFPYTPPAPLNVIPGQYAVYHNGAWHLMPSSAI